MLLSHLTGKEIINIHDGAKLGLIQDADLDISINGGIEAIIMPLRIGFSSFWSGRAAERDSLIIPWKNEKKIGSEVIIVDMHHPESYEKSERYSKFV